MKETRFPVSLNSRIPSVCERVKDDIPFMNWMNGMVHELNSKFYLHQAGKRTIFYEVSIILCITLYSACRITKYRKHHESNPSPLLQQCVHLAVPFITGWPIKWVIRLGWLRFGKFPGWWATPVGTYWPSRMLEYRKSSCTVYWNLILLLPAEGLTTIGGKTILMFSLVPNCHMGGYVPST